MCEAPTFTAQGVRKVTLPVLALAPAWNMRDFILHDNRTLQGAELVGCNIRVIFKILDNLPI